MGESVATKIKKARLKFIRQSSGDMVHFLGGFAYKFLWEVHKMSPEAEGYVKLDPRDRTDGKIHINEDMASKDDYTFHNLCFLVSHECLHILNKHGVRRGRREPKMWNVACDHCIDRDLRDVKAFGPYQNRYNIIDDLHSEQPNCTAEQAYTWLTKHAKKIQVAQLGSGMLQVTDTSTGKQWMVNPNSGGVEDDKLTPEEREVTRQLTEQYLAEARTLHQSMKMKGSMTGDFAEYLEKMLKVEVPWQELLEKAIKTNVQMVPDDRSWSNPNKYFRHLGMTLPGVHMIEERDSIGTLVIAVDTSGSISQKSLKEFAGIIFDSMKFFAKIVVMVHDVDVHQIKEFDKDNIAEFHHFITKEGFKGRGGTSHQPVFESIQKLIWDDPDERNDLSMVISLTDGYSDIQGIWTNYQFMKEAPIVFLIDGDYKLELGGTSDKNMTMINIKGNRDED